MKWVEQPLVTQLYFLYVENLELMRRSGEGEMFEELTDQQKILKYTALLLKDKDSAVADAIQTLIVTYEQLDDTSKAVLEKIAKQYIDNLKKSQ